MYSQCPDCQTRFRVTAEALRAARGTVRCGRCGSAFDALERLSDSIPPPVPENPPVPLLVATDDPGTAEPGIDAEYHFSAEDLERVFVEAKSWRDSFPASPATEADRPSPAAVGIEPTFVVVDEESGVEDITLEGERIRVAAADGEPREIDVESTDEFEILRDLPESAFAEDDGTAAAAASELTDEDVAAAVGRLAADESLEPADSRVAAPIEPGPALPPAEVAVPLAAQRWRRPAAEEPEEPRARSSWVTLGWSLGSLLLVLVLAAQVVHHFRQDLVRHPQVGPFLRTAYERLGLGLLPNWDLAAFELRQWGNAEDAGRMVVRASLTNRAAFAQPHPVLRLELEDRYGGTVATRDFEPADYLKNPAAAGRLIEAGSSSEAELLLADPGPEAVGYRLDVCLRESDSLLRCARGPG